MTTVLIVDDEELTCKSLVRNIEWEQLQLQLMGCAYNGQEALKYLETTPPDILITDIFMPLVSGMELAQYIYEKELPIKVIILSGHQEFRYAQQGIQYNVANYLIKPCEKEQINKVLKRLVTECIHEKKELLEKRYFESFVDNCKPQLREKLLLDLIHGNLINEESLKQKCLFLNMDKNLSYFVIIAEVDNKKERFVSLQEKEKIFVSLHLSQAFSSVFPETQELTFLSITEGRYIILIPKYATDDIVGVCNNVRETFHSYTDLSATFGIGGAPVELIQLKEAYERAEETLLYKYLTGRNTVICYEDIITITTCEKQLTNTIFLQTQIIQEVRAGNSEDIESLYDEWFGVLEGYTPMLVKSLIIQFVGNLSVELMGVGISLTELFGDADILIEKVLRFDTIFDVKFWLRQILQFICEDIGAKNQRSTAHLVKKAAQFMDEHLGEDINVDTIASHVYLSSGYLMTIFKREMGISIISYLTAKRMEKAKELLLENDLKIYEIANEVGYSNATFFSSTFRNHVGLSPKQFKERYLNRDNATLE